MNKTLTFNFSIDRQQESALAMAITTNDNYLVVYTEFLDYFNRLDTTGLSYKTIC